VELSGRWGLAEPLQEEPLQDMETSELIEVLGSREELQRLFQQSGLIHADETPVQGLGVGDVDLGTGSVFGGTNGLRRVGAPGLQSRCPEA